MIDNTQIYKYRDCFSTVNGRKVLGHILIDLGYFDEAVTPEQEALRSYATKLLGQLGIFGLENVELFVNKLFEIPPIIKEIEDGKED